MPTGSTITYAVAPLNRRTGKSINGQLQWQLVWRGRLRPRAQLNPDGSVMSLFLYGDKPNVPEAMVKNGVTYRILADQLGRGRLVTDLSGNVIQQMDYDAWGLVVNDTNPGFQPFGFAGGWYDSDTSLVRFGARDYDAHTGRWTTKDPIVFGGGLTSLYAYVGGEPVNQTDPSGLQGIPIGPILGVGLSEGRCYQVQQGGVQQPSYGFDNSSSGWSSSTSLVVPILNTPLGLEVTYSLVQNGSNSLYIGVRAAGASLTDTLKYACKVGSSGEFFLKTSTSIGWGVGITAGTSVSYDPSKNVGGAEGSLGLSGKAGFDGGFRQ